MAVLNIKQQNLNKLSNEKYQTSTSNGSIPGIGTNQQTKANNVAANQNTATQQTASQQAAQQAASQQQTSPTTTGTTKSYATIQSTPLTGAFSGDGYKSKYGQQLNDIIKQIQSTPDFKYEFNQDPLFGYYKDLYQRNGQQAMMDTIGQASAMTGGYGNSYAASVGNQSYQNWLRNIYDKGMEFRNAARQNYDTDLSNLYNQYNMLHDADSADYQQWIQQQQLALQQAQLALEREQWEWQKAQAEAAAAASGGGGGGGRGGSKKQTTTTPKVSDPIKQGANILTSVLNGVNNNVANNATNQTYIPWNDTHTRVNEQRKKEKYYAK